MGIVDKCRRCGRRVGPWRGASTVVVVLCGDVIGAAAAEAAATRDGCEHAKCADRVRGVSTRVVMAETGG